MIHLVDADRGLDHARRIMEQLKGSGRKAILALNKIDSIKLERLLPLAADGGFRRLFGDLHDLRADTTASPTSRPRLPPDAGRA
jgi:GTP-binding protein Era